MVRLNCCFKFSLLCVLRVNYSGRRIVCDSTPFLSQQVVSSSPPGNSDSIRPVITGAAQATRGHQGPPGPTKSLSQQASCVASNKTDLLPSAALYFFLVQKLLLFYLLCCFRVAREAYEGITFHFVSKQCERQWWESPGHSPHTKHARRAGHECMETSLQSQQFPNHTRGEGPCPSPYPQVPLFIIEVPQAPQSPSSITLKHGWFAVLLLLLLILTLDDVI